MPEQVNQMSATNAEPNAEPVLTGKARQLANLRPWKKGQAPKGGRKPMTEDERIIHRLFYRKLPLLPDGTKIAALEGILMRLRHKAIDKNIDDTDVQLAMVERCMGKPKQQVVADVTSHEDRRIEIVFPGSYEFDSDHPENAILGGQPLNRK